MKRSYIVIPNWNKITARILERDNYKCIKCGMSNKDHKKKWNRRLTVDHIDGNTQNNIDENLMTLCIVCHARKDGLRTHVLVLEKNKHKVIYDYLTETMSANSIASKYEVSLEVTMRSLRRWNVPLRDRSTAMKIFTSNPKVRLNMSIKTAAHHKYKKELKASFEKEINIKI